MKLSKKEIIFKSWDLMKDHIAILSIMVLFIFTLNIILSVIQDKLMIEMTYQSIIFIISAYLFHMGLNLGLVRIVLDIINNKEINFSSLFTSFHMLMPYVIASVIYLFILLLVAMPGILLLVFSISVKIENIFSSEGGMFTILSILLIIIPTIYLSVRLQFYNYFLIDQECGIIESIKKSADISKGHILELFIFGAYLSIIVLLALIPLIIGLSIGTPLVIIFALPLGIGLLFTILATGYVYFILSGEPTSQ